MDWLSPSVFCFFFQAEDGIRDDLVTGVQTCALPILNVEFGDFGITPRKGIFQTFDGSMMPNLKTNFLKLRAIRFCSIMLFRRFDTAGEPFSESTAKCLFMPRIDQL